jgi:hypothetical protein
MDRIVLLLACLSLSAFPCCTAAAAGDQSADAAKLLPLDQGGFVVLPGGTNAVQFRLYTNASPDAAHLFNTFEIEAFGKKLLQSPGAESMRQWLRAAPTNGTLHNVLVNSLGPEPGITNSMKLLEQTSGRDWCYVALDLTPAYGGSLKQYQRSILFVAPDLFVLYDHLVGRERLRFEMFLHPPAAARVDPAWGDVRLETPEASVRINAPSRRELRSWERINSSADAILPNTMTVRIGPTNKVSQLDLLTVFAVRPGGKTMDYVFKLVESNTAVGARIHRDGLPTLVAFRLDPASPESSLDSFKFTGPVGVAVFRPKLSGH